MNNHSIRRISTCVLFSLFAYLVFVGLSAAQPVEREPSKEEPIWQELSKISPESLAKFKEATIALDSQNLAEAIKLYNEVLKAAPDFQPALRRLGYSLVATGKRQEGLAMTKKALDLERSADNLIGHAAALTDGRGTAYEATTAELQEALTLTKEAAKKGGDADSDALMFMAQLSLSLDRMEDFNYATSVLETKFPDLAGTHYFAGLRLANAGDLDGAEARIKKAEAMGLPHEASEPLLAAIEAERDKAFFGLGKYFYYGLYLVAAWAIGLVALFVAGKVLSSKTLSSIETSDPNDISGGGQASLRKIYRRVISIAGAYYYFSQPVVILLVVMATVGIIFFFIWLGQIPVKIVLVLAFVGLAAIFYLVKSLVIRPKMEDPGRALIEQEAPGLWQLTRDVAQAIDTRPVDEIRITHGTDLAVYERGSFRQKVQNQAERILIVGTAALNGFSQTAFRAVLAHEYGHFSNRDTAGGDIAFRVNSDIIRVAESMALSGTATFYNIAFQFLRIYHFLFRRITHGATRLQEVLADRVAVYHYGAAAFREGLEHVIRREVEFNHVAENEINAAISGNRALQNLYEMSVQDEPALKDVEQQVNSVLSQPTTEDDTHPSPEDRFKFAERIRSKETAHLTGLVWELFADRETLTLEMNGLIEKMVRENG